MANIIFIIDGNNFLCEENRVSVPTCNHIDDFLLRIDDWMKFNASQCKKKYIVYVVFDSGANLCSPTSAYAYVEVATNEKADSVILRLAQKLNMQSKNKIIIVSNEQGNEFLTLRKQGFRQERNSAFSKRIKLGEGKTKSYYDYNLEQELKSLFGVEEDE